MQEKKNRVETAVQDLIEQVFATEPFSLYDLEFVKEGSDCVLRIFIDKDGGVDLNDCEAVTRLLEEPLDRLDPISEPYLLEVSSPGVERRLKTKQHFKQAVGEKIVVKCYAPLDGKKEFCGLLCAVDGDSITVQLDGEEKTISFEQIAKAQLSVF